jgi:hypothetical protein
MNKKVTISLSAEDREKLKGHSKANGRTVSGTIKLALSSFYLMAGDPDGRRST